MFELGSRNDLLQRCSCHATSAIKSVHSFSENTACCLPVCVLGFPADGVWVMWSWQCSYRNRIFTFGVGLHSMVILELFQQQGRAWLALVSLVCSGILLVIPCHGEN